MVTAVPTPANTETYGIHLLKVCAIMLQVLAHSYLWSVQQGLLQVGNIGTTLNHLSYALLSSALFLPMTAGAVMRILAKVQGDRVVDVDWSGVIGLSLALALIESVKQTLVYHGAGFFSWNVLHLIAITVPLMLWVATYSIRLVWSLGLTIMLVTPAIQMPLMVHDITMQLPATVLGFSLRGLVFAALLSLLMLSLLGRVRASGSFAPAHKKRFLGFLIVLWGIGLWWLLGMAPSPMDAMEIGSLPLGMLIGTENGMHIWGFFPWAGSIFLAFGIFDLIIRKSASTQLLLGMVAAAVIMLLIFRDRYIYEVTSSLSATAFFSGYHFNRLPEKLLMVVALFMLAVPVFIWLARRGLETPYIVLLSRYVLWLYIYQTTLLLALPGWVQQIFAGHLTNLQCMIVSTVLSFASAVALPAVFKRLPLSLKLQLKKA